jgi:hypothetical protein
MISFIIFCLATIGLTNILVHGRILDLIFVFGRSIRGWMQYFEWSKSLFECYECTGFWAGLVCGYTLMSQQWFMVLMCGFAGSVIAQGYTDFIFWLRSNISYEVGSDSH